MSSCNGLASSKRKAITWSNDDPFTDVYICVTLPQCVKSYLRYACSICRLTWWGHCYFNWTLNTSITVHCLALYARGLFILSNPFRLLFRFRVFINRLWATGPYKRTRIKVSDKYYKYIHIVIRYIYIYTTRQQAPFLLTLFNLTAWISNYIHYIVWNEITYPFPNFQLIK